MPPKKNALFQAIQKAKGEILCFTDADCLPQPEWLEEIVACFSPSVGLVAGYSPYLIDTEKRSLLHFFIAYEEFRAATWTAGSIAIGKGWLCTGRNLEYRKKVFEAVGGYEKIKHSISGDDDLFLQLVQRTTDWKIQYLTTQKSQIPTFPPPTFRDFVEQRKRHFSAAKFFPFSMKFILGAYHFSNFFIIVTFFFSIFFTQYFIYASEALLVKLISDYILLHKGATLLHEKHFLRYIVPMEFFYTAYNSFIGPLGLLLKFKWKPQQ